MTTSLAASGVVSVQSRLRMARSGYIGIIVKFLEGNKIQVYPPQQYQNLNFRRGGMFQDGI